MRLRMVSVAATATLTLLATAATPAFAVTRAAPPTDPTVQTVPLPRPQASPRRTTKVEPAAPQPAGDCQAMPRAYAVSGKHVVACRTFKPLPAKPSRTGVTPSASTCSVSGAQWAFTRYTGCSSGREVIITFFVQMTGQPLGGQLWTIEQSITLSPASDLFTENDVVTWASADPGIASYPVDLSYRGLCTSPCRVVSAGSTSEMSPGSVLTVPMTFESNPGTSMNTTNVSYDFFTTTPPDVAPGPPLPPWSMPAAVRCDNLLAGQKPGCVFPDFVPDLDLSLGTYGAAAANVAAGEALVDHFGTLAKPMHREANEATANNNRNIVCAGFTAKSTVPNDSCDEYAFARSKESGGALGLSAGNCSEGTPTLTNGQWTMVYSRHTATDRCLRGHVPNPQNGAVGGVYGNLVQQDRILDNDPFTVTVIP